MSTSEEKDKHVSLVIRGVRIAAEKALLRVRQGAEAALRELETR
jgi:hypothetical protein